MTITGNSKASSKDSNVNRRESSGKDNKSKDNSQHHNNAGSATDNEVDKHKRFENEGVTFKAKLIGSELVMEPRGDKMCQNSIQRLKAIIKGTNSHKKRIVLKISYDGVKVFDEKSNEMLHQHEVSQISYIASDDTDNRTFGYVSDVPSKAHQFICFKTSGPAINVMSVISALFEAVLEKKNKAEKEKQQLQQQQHGITATTTTTTNNPTTTSLQQQDSIDLIGDSGIMDGDASILSDDLTSSTKHQHMSTQQQPPQSSSIFESIVASPGDSFSSIKMGANNNRSKQSASAADLIFDDLFAGLSDPIIVDKNDSLISYKPDTSTRGAAPLGTSNLTSASLPIGSHPVSQRPAPSLHCPIPRRQNQTQHHHQHHPILQPPPPSSLPRPAPMMMASAPTHNRSLVYNHSSVSLSDAALTRQSSFTSPTSNDSYVDRYAVFNDIDNLPSIFESTSLGNVNKPNTVSNSAQIGPLSSSNADANMFRQRNPFDDDFFA